MYGYLKKPVKAQVDAIWTSWPWLPEVAECYEHWNRLRDELERYYKDTPREHKPLSQQQEFKAIKNMIIRGGGGTASGCIHLRGCFHGG